MLLATAASLAMDASAASDTCVSQHGDRDVHYFQQRHDGRDVLRFRICCLPRQGYIRQVTPRPLLLMPCIEGNLYACVGFKCHGTCFDLTWHDVFVGGHQL